MFYQTQTACRPPKGPKNAVFCPWWPWPLTLTFKLVRARDQTRFRVNLVQIRSTLSEIFHTRTKQTSHRQCQRQNLTTLRVENSGSKYTFGCTKCPSVLWHWRLGNRKPHRIPVPLIFKHSLLEQVEEEGQQETTARSKLIKPFHLKNGHLKWRLQHKIQLTLRQNLSITFWKPNLVNLLLHLCFLTIKKVIFLNDHKNILRLNLFSPIKPFSLQFFTSWYY